MITPPLDDKGNLSPKVAYVAIGVTVAGFLGYVGYSIIASRRTNAEIIRRFDEHIQGYILRLESNMPAEGDSLSREGSTVDGGEAHPE